MKSVEFDEASLSDLESIAKKLLEDENDPRSSSYKRVLVRPKINWLKVFLFIFVPLAALSLFGWFLVGCSLPMCYVVLSMAVVYILFLLINIKRITIFFIKVYQRYAPDSVRNQCRFEPSCSVYMIMAIEKYGFLKGAKKGINRIKRCNINDGGYDYP